MQRHAIGPHFSARTGFFTTVEGIMYSYKYQTILEQNLQVSASKQKIKSIFTFQHNNDLN